jgi:hypothetical protein
MSTGSTPKKTRTTGGRLRAWTSRQGWRALAVLPTELRGFLDKHKPDADAALRTCNQRGWLLPDEGYPTKKVTVGTRKAHRVVIARAKAVSGESVDPSERHPVGMRKAEVGSGCGPRFGAVDPRQAPECWHHLPRITAGPRRFGPMSANRERKRPFA